MKSSSQLVKLFHKNGRFNSNGSVKREVLETDVLIVGAGPAGLAAAYHLKKQDPQKNIVVLEKAPYVGAHIVSGAVLDPKGFSEIGLLESLKATKLLTPVSKDDFWILMNEKRKFKLPFIPKLMRNEGNYVASLSQVTSWFGEQVSALGVDVFPGFAAASLIYENDAENKPIVKGVITNDLGVRKSGEKGPNYQPGMEIRSPITLIAEGAHGHLSKQIINKFELQEGHQTYGIGLKEVWQVPKAHIQPGTVLHTLGWPMTDRTYGGGFLYSFNNLENENYVNLAVGFVVGLDYRNPYLNPYQEFQLFKTHPGIKNLIYTKESKVIAYGARALTEGGWQSLPKLNFPGGALLGCAAGMMNVPRIKGSHNAIKSGMLAAECILKNNNLEEYDNMVRSSWIARELEQVRNVRPSFVHFGFYGALLHSGASVILRGKEPHTLAHASRPDYELDLASKHKKPNYPKPDNEYTFDLLTNLSRTGTMHNEDQPSHLQLKQGPDPQLTINYPQYDGPESKFCPAGVYEYVRDENDQLKFQINAQNCIHCKTCDIKDPSQNINWTVPEGGGGPKYTIL